MRLLYTALLYLLVPVILARLLWKARRDPGYSERLGERFGWVERSAQPTVWVHAVSVGEFQAALPLIKRLLADPEVPPVVVTTTTPSGADRVQAALGERVTHCYTPYDLPGAVNRFLERMQPQAAVIMETELWPNLFRACSRRRIPVLLANARLSARSAARYARFKGFTRRTLDDLTAIAAQGQGDADRIIELGGDPAKVEVTGSIKFDVELPAQLREEAAVLRRQWGVERPVWIAASTHEGEEEQVMAAFAQVRAMLPSALLVLVPRHPERCSRVKSLCQREGYAVYQRTEARTYPVDTVVFLGDTMGELPLFYAASDVAFVGGSLVPHGGHNVLEAASLELPVVVGPHVFNFQEITELLLEAGGGRQVDDATGLATAVLDFLQDANLRYATGQQGRALVERNRGALHAIEHRVRALLAPRRGAQTNG